MSGKGDAGGVARWPGDIGFRGLNGLSVTQTKDRQASCSPERRKEGRECFHVEYQVQKRRVAYKWC